VRDGVVAVAQRAAAQPRMALAIEAAVLLCALALWRLTAFVRRRRYVSRMRTAVARRLECIDAYVRCRSRRLAAALPHLCYVLMCVACTRLFSRLGMHASALAAITATEPWLSTALPALRCLLLLGASPVQQLPCLQYWVVWASVELIKDMLHAVPFAPRMGRAVLTLADRWWPMGMLYEIPFCAYLWLQLPGRRGLVVAYRLVAPQLQRRAARFGDLLPSVPERTTGILRMALAAAIGMDRSSALIDAVCEGRLLLVGMVFLLMPSQIAAFGLPLLALGGPILRSINAIGSIEATQARQGSKAREEAELHGDSQTTITASTSSAQLRLGVVRNAVGRRAGSCASARLGSLCEPSTAARSPVATVANRPRRHASTRAARTVVTCLTKKGP